ncbi:MAG: lytic transglycosylase domain-containing protein, partial [Candidatus Adiutrix sp.]
KKRHQGALYFLARAFELDGQMEKSQKTYQQAAQEPFSYYQIAALSRLSEKPAKTLAPLMAQLLESGPSSLDKHSLGYLMWVQEKGLSSAEMEKAAQRLAHSGGIFQPRNNLADINEQLVSALNDFNWAQTFNIFKKYEKDIKSGPLSTQGQKDWLPLIATIAAENGDYRQAIRLFSQIKSRKGKKFYTWGHPMVYAQGVLDAYRHYGLAPQLTLALIRTESAFQADIISASNARGLMQILPATSNKIAKFLPLEGASFGDEYLHLFDPKINIQQGTWYLNELIEGFGSVPLALAGYNGGPYNIKSFINAKPNLPLDLFIETLPFAETANYVRRIIESIYVYEQAYLGQASLFDLTAPISPPHERLPTF